MDTTFQSSVDVLEAARKLAAEVGGVGQPADGVAAAHSSAERNPRHGLPLSERIRRHWQLAQTAIKAGTKLEATMKAIDAKPGSEAHRRKLHQAQVAQIENNIASARRAILDEIEQQERQLKAQHDKMVAMLGPESGEARRQADLNLAGQLAELRDSKKGFRLARAVWQRRSVLRAQLKEVRAQHRADNDRMAVRDASDALLKVGMFVKFINDVTRPSAPKPEVQAPVPQLV